MVPVLQVRYKAEGWTDNKERGKNSVMQSQVYYIDVFLFVKYFNFLMQLKIVQIMHFKEAKWCHTLHSNAMICDEDSQVDNTWSILYFQGSWAKKVENTMSTHIHKSHVGFVKDLPCWVCFITHAVTHSSSSSFTQTEKKTLQLISVCLSLCVL